MPQGFDATDGVALRQSELANIGGSFDSCRERQP